MKKETKTAPQTAVPEKLAAPERVHGLDLISKYRGAIMGFAALWILFFHEWVTLFVNNQVGVNIEGYLKRIGFCGVDIFLLLSGIGLTFAIRKGNVLTFYYRRIKRILLPFLVMAIIRCALEKWPIIEFWKNISGINFYTKSIYSFLWFVPAILTLYLFFPWYYKLFTKTKKPVLFFLCSLEVWLVFSLFVRETMRGDLYGFTNRIPVFLAGVLLGWLTQQKKTTFTKGTWCLIAITFVAGLYLAYITNYKDYYLLVPTSNCCVPNFMISVSLPFLMAKFLDILSHAKYTKPVGIGLTKVLSFFGTFSLEFYCVQEWLGWKIMGKMFEQQRPGWLINLAVLLAITAVSFAAHFLFQQFWKLVDWLIGMIPKPGKKAAAEQSK